MININGIEQFGIFAKCDIKENQLIDICRIIPIDRSIIKATRNDLITKYWFHYNDKFVILPLGNGAIYNHSLNNNANHYFDKMEMFIYSIKVIKQNEEIFFNYGYDIFKHL